jgi:hypothetical protein
MRSARLYMANRWAPWSLVKLTLFSLHIFEYPIWVERIHGLPRFDPVLWRQAC